LVDSVSRTEKITGHVYARIGVWFNALRLSSIASFRDYPCNYRGLDLALEVHQIGLHGEKSVPTQCRENSLRSLGLEKPGIRGPWVSSMQDLEQEAKCR